MTKVAKFFLCILLTLSIGGISGYFTASSIPTWFAALNKPTFNPPNYLFGPVWTFLYLMMGISFYMILEKVKAPNRAQAITVFAIQLALNFLWSFIFFNFHLIGLALIEIVVLWASILAMIAVFYKTDKWAAFLNIPYLFWVSFASILNLGFYWLN